MPVPVILAAMLALWAVDLRHAYVALHLMFALQFALMTLVSWLIVYLLARSYLANGSTGLLLLACGMVFWGLSGVAGIAAGHGDFNRSVTTHNLCMWLAALCQLMGAFLGNSTVHAPARRGWRLLGCVAASTATIMLVAFVVLKGWTPTFFVQGQGGTLERQAVLGTAIAMFLVAAMMLHAKYRSRHSAFIHWYALGLVLNAVGLFGVMMARVHSSALDWAGVLTQVLGGIYLIAAARAAARESSAWEFSMALAPRDPRLRYVLAVMFAGAAIALRMLFVDTLGTRAVGVTFYPAVILAALYAGRGPAAVTALISGVAIAYFSDSLGTFQLADPGDWLALALFGASSALIIWITEAIRAYQMLESTSRAKDQFIAMLSHELRNPLSTLTAAAHVLKLAPDSGASAAAREVVERQTEHMSRLVDDLLDISRISAGKLAVERAPLDLGALVSGIVALWRASGRLERHRVTCAAQAAWIEGDGARIQQIVTNLLDNALKFTPAGRGVAVTVALEDGAAVLRVADEGEGLPGKSPERFFELFVQGENAAQRGGMGVGLMLVKRLAELHGGSVEASSEGPGRGALFTVRLPLLEREPVSPAGPGQGDGFGYSPSIFPTTVPR